MVQNQSIKSIDEFKGRIVKERRWPAGLHAALEAKEGVAHKAEGKVLASITLQNLISLYPKNLWDDPGQRRLRQTSSIPSIRSK